MAEVIKTTFQLKRGLSSAWKKANPILSPGEPGWAIDTKVLKIGDGVTPWNLLNAVNEIELSEEQVQHAISKYLQEHPISVITDTTLSVQGMPADAASVRDNCVFNTDQIIFYAGDADDNIFN